MPDTSAVVPAFVLYSFGIVQIVGIESEEFGY